MLAVLSTAAPRHAEAVPLSLYGDYFAYWETQGLLLGHGMASRHLVTKSTAKGRLLERSSSVTQFASKSSKKKKKGSTKPSTKVGRSKDKFDDDAPVVNKRKLQRARDEELEILTTFVEESVQTRLGARISKAWWTAEGNNNGSAGFVPPAVKARELQQALALYAESLLDPEWVPAFDETSAVAETGALLRQLFKMGGMAEAMNAVTPTTMADVNVTNWWIDEDGDADGGDYDDSNQSGAGTGDRRDWYGGSLGPAQAISENAKKQKQSIEEKHGKPELYPIKPRKKLTPEEEEDEMWLATKKGMNLAQIVPLRFKTKGSKVVQRPSPWKPHFVTGFLKPLLKVLKRFLTLEIKSASAEEQVLRLKAVCDVLLQGFQNVYEPVAKEYIDNDYELPGFREEMAKINSQLKDEREEAAKKAALRPPSKFGNNILLQTRALQIKTTLEDLYLAAHRVMPRFRLFMEDVATRSRAMQGSGVAPMKSMYRSMEKAAFRADGEQWSVDCVLDVVRGSLRFESMRAFTRCLQIIGNYEGVQIRRLKDRFSNPTASGWRDCLLNISFTDDPDKFICEVQLVHHHMMNAEETGTMDYNDLITHRSASELLRIVAELEKQKNQHNGLTAAEAKRRRGLRQRSTSQRTDAVYLKHVAQQQQANTIAASFEAV